jgi:type II secretory pathway component PulF
MEADIQQRLDVLEKKIDATFKSAEKTRKYLFWAGVVSIALFVLPLIGLIFAVPTFLSTYSQMGALGI